MNKLTDRAAGAVLGGLIGDALGLGPHWYYDLRELRRDYGEWIDGYTDPRPKRYHGGMRAGQLSQTGLITYWLMESVVDRGEYSEADFVSRLETDLFHHIDGFPMEGPGGYTNQSIREAYQGRVRENKTWNEVGGLADTTESAERGVVLAARYARSPRLVAETVSENGALTQSDPAINAMATAFNCVVAALIRGTPFDANISDVLLSLVRSGELPFHSVTDPGLRTVLANGAAIPQAGHFSSPDALLTPSHMAEAAHDRGIKIEPAWKVSIVYGMPCAIYHQLPAAYYLAARFPDNFEKAVLNAINGGGQNMSRAFLTGALVGAQVGASGIPRRLIDGLENSVRIVEYCHRLGELAEAPSSIAR